MKCPNCGKEAGFNKVCPDCGTEVAPTEPETKTFEPMNGGKKKTNSIIFVGLVVIIAIIAVVIYYVLQMNNPRYIFDKKIDEFLSMESENSDYKTMKLNADLQFSVDSDDENAKIVSDLVNDATFSFNAEVDLENQEEIIGLKVDKSKDEVLNISAKLESETQQMYIALGKLFNKPIKMDIEEVTDTKFEMADVTAISLGQRVNQEKANSILKKEVKAQLKDEYFSSEDTTINDEKVTKNTLKLTGEQLVNVMKNTCKNLSENKEFIECFKDEEEVKDNLKQLYEGVDDLDVSKDGIFEIAVYAKGFNKSVKRVDVFVTDEESEVTVELTKINDEEYDYIVKSEGDKAFDGKIKSEIDKGSCKIEITFEADGTKVTYKINGNLVYDEPISDFDTSDAIGYEDFTQDDVKEISSNFMNSKLYEIINGLSSSNSSLIDDEYDKKDDDKDIDDDDEKDEDEEEEKEDDEKTSKSSSIDQIESYDGDKIKFNIPSGYECYSSENDHYKLFEKELDDGDISVSVSAEYNTLDEYIASNKETYQKRENETNYSNIVISDVEEVEVKGNKFKKLTVKYDYGFSDDEKTTYTKYFIAHEIDAKNLYTVEVDGAETISDKDLETFLTIE